MKRATETIVESRYRVVIVASVLRVVQRQQIASSGDLETKVINDLRLDRIGREVLKRASLASLRRAVKRYLDALLNEQFLKSSNVGYRISAKGQRWTPIAISSEIFRLHGTMKDTKWKKTSIPRDSWLVSDWVEPNVARFPTPIVKKSVGSPRLFVNPKQGSAIHLEREHGSTKKAQSVSKARSKLTKSSVVDQSSIAKRKIFFATDRAYEGGEQSDLVRFSGERSDPERMIFGTCEISIPPGHRTATLESPSIWRLEFKPDPRKHVTVTRVTVRSVKNFQNSVKADVASSPDNDLMVFVHGYNVDFRDAARRTGQLAYDLSFKGPAISYSWPSEGRVLRYDVDENNSEWTQPHLAGFLKMLANEIKPRIIHLIAHSMGNRALVGALALIGNSATLTTRFNEVVLTAPDIDQGVFSGLADAMKRASGRITLYASSRDKALNLSKRINGYSRAGDAKPNLVVIEGIDTIDVSKVRPTCLVIHISEITRA